MLFQQKEKKTQDTASSQLAAQKEKKISNYGVYKYIIGFVVFVFIVITLFCLINYDNNTKPNSKTSLEYPRISTKPISTLLSTAN